jgi:hypothetical protein
MLLIELVAGLLWSGLAARSWGADYQFPQGVPYDARKVEWYAATDHFQYFDGAGFNGWHDRTQDLQTWNNEHPWKTGGLDRSDNVKTFKFYVPAATGRPEFWRERGRYFSNAHPAGYHKFRLPSGTVFGEVIQVDGVTTEVGILELTNAAPKFRVFRPFRTRRELQPHIVRERWLAQAIRNVHPTKVIDLAGQVLEVELSPAGVKAILAQPFVDVTDLVFAIAPDGSKSYAPTTAQRHGLVPRYSERGLFTSRTCVQCHQTAGQEGRLLDPNPRPDKYGAIRGGGHVFSVPFSQWLKDGRLKEVRP